MSTIKEKEQAIRSHCLELALQYGGQFKGKGETVDPTQLAESFEKYIKDGTLQSDKS